MSGEHPGTDTRIQSGFLKITSALGPGVGAAEPISVTQRSHECREIFTIGVQSVAAMTDAITKASEFGIAAPESEAAGAIRLGWARSPWILLGVLVCSYIGIYLCRKNLSVAVPLLQSEWGVTKSQIGWLASVSTVAYAAGKILFGPIIDRFGGRVSLIASMALVGVFCALGGLAPGLGALTLLYSVNRLAGSASWGAMVKLTPSWFSSCRLPLALGILSCSYVFGGALATAFAGFVADATDNNWRLILSLPSGFLLLFLLVALVQLPNDAASQRSQEEISSPRIPGAKTGPGRVLCRGIRTIPAHLPEPPIPAHPGIEFRSDVRAGDV